MKTPKFTAKNVRLAFRKHSSPARAKASQRFFKTGPGEYGEGDIFLGATMPETREISKKFRNLEIKEIKKLLHSKIHEYRMTALLIIVDNYERSSQKEKIKWFKLFWNERQWINNWDLVDVTVPRVVGDYFINRSRVPLYTLIKSKNIWERRIAVLATFPFIANHDFADSLKFAKLLLTDTHDLMHKAVGWMLREIGKRSRPTLEQFLSKHLHQMSRTMLRYAIEHFPEKQRKSYLKK